VSWPKELTIRSKPLGLVDHRGRVVARVGDLLHIGGGSAPRDHPMDPRCRVSDSIFVANEINNVTA
jgi:hypothetical protein